jgi:hypothetical protein
MATGFFDRREKTARRSRRARKRAFSFARRGEPLATPKSPRPITLASFDELPIPCWPRCSRAFKVRREKRPDQPDLAGKFLEYGAGPLSARVSRTRGRSGRRICVESEGFGRAGWRAICGPGCVVTGRKDSRVCPGAGRGDGCLRRLFTRLPESRLAHGLLDWLLAVGASGRSRTGTPY